MAILGDISCKQLFAFPEMAKELLCAAIDEPWTRTALPEDFERSTPAMSAQPASSVMTTSCGVFLLRLEQADVKYDNLQSLLEKLNLWLKQQSNSNLVQTIEALVRHKVHAAIRQLPQAFNLGEVTEMLDQQFDTYIDYLKFQTTRQERIKGMWEGRKHGRRLARAAAQQEGILEGRREMICLLLERAGSGKPGSLVR